MNKNDLQEICLIVNKRNELQKVRNSARHRVIRLEKIIRSKQIKAERRKLELLADKKTNKFYKRLKTIKSMPASYFPDYDSRRAHNAFFEQYHRGAEQTYINATEELNEEYKYRRAHVPNKHDKSSLHHLKMVMQKAIAEREMAKYEIMMHTEETTKRLRRLLKKNGIQQRSDHNGGVSSLIYEEEYVADDDGIRLKTRRISAEKIREIAFDASIELELSNA